MTSYLEISDCFTGDAEDEEVKKEENNVSEEPNHYIVSEKGKYLI